MSVVASLPAAQATVKIMYIKNEKYGKPFQQTRTNPVALRTRLRRRRNISAQFH